MYEPKRTDFFPPLNANELVPPDPFSGEGGASRAYAVAYQQQQQSNPNMICWDYKKMSGWIFTIIGWLFSHTTTTQLCSNTL